MRRDRMMAGLLAACLAPAGVWAQEPPALGPATVAEAVRAIDLEALPLMGGAKAPGERNAASLSYEAPGEPPEAFGFYRDLLAGQGWRPLGEPSVIKESASATFGKGGFTLALSAYSIGRPGKCNLSIQVLGNVDLARLPRPAGTTPVYEGPASASYAAEGGVDATAKAVGELLARAGWEPYGAAGDVRYYKKNAIKLSARVSASPAQGGRTTIDYSTALMAADLPAPASATRVQYSDQPIQLSADALGTQDEVVAFYKDRLAPLGWTPTTPKPIRSGNRNVIYFRNERKDMLRLELGLFEGQVRYLIRKQSAEAVAKAEARVDAIRKDAEARQNAMGGRPSPRPSLAAPGPKKAEPKIAIALPEGAANASARGRSLKFKVPPGQAQGVVDGFRRAYVGAGWKEAASALQAKAGSVTLAKDAFTLSISYTDTGFFPPEISFLATGAELTIAPAR